MKASAAFVLSGILAIAAGAGCGGGTPQTPPPDPSLITTSGLGPDEPALQVMARCPGDPGCPDQGDGQLFAAAAKRDITPVVEPFVDLNNNEVYDDGEPYTDLNSNGKFDPVWIAGYGSGRLAFGIHDPTWLRCYVLRQNQTTVAHCVVDCVGYFQNEQEQIRADLDPKLGVDLLMMGASHLHETQDSVGIWGPDDTTSGYDPAYMLRIRKAAVDAITEAVGKLKPAKMTIGSILVEDPDHSMVSYVSDTRDPVVIDNRMHVMQFDAADDGKPISTVLVWASHPESVGSHNHYVTNDFTYYLRRSVERHTGSDVVFVNGALGGQVGPGAVQPRGDDGKLLPRGERSFRFAQAWGEGLADFAMKAFDKREMVPSPKLRFLYTMFNAHVENSRYHTAFFLKILNREVFGYDKGKPLLRTEEFDNAPLVRSEAAYLTLGPASISTAPGELLPELFLGGYDGSRAGTYQFIDTKQPNSPDPSKAPKAPYLIDMMKGPVEHRMIFGLTLDFLGYIVPRYNFVLDDLAPYVGEAKGDHYEETNSIGPRAEPEIVGMMRQLVLQMNADLEKQK